MVNVSVVGATGYTGAELVRLLAKHPKLEINTLTSNTFAGQKISDIYPNLKGMIDIECEKLELDKVGEGSEFIFTALPHGISMDVVPKLVERGIKVIDLSGDYRYSNLITYEEWYKEHSSPKLLREGVYGLPELGKEKIKEAKLVANPGCYPTASILALAPMVKEGLIEDGSIIIDAKSGTTGAGRKVSLGTHFCEIDSNFKAYKVGNHRHTSEIEEKLSLVGDNDVSLTFTPHLLPVKRGILATIYGNLTKGVEIEELLERYRLFYKANKFVRILDMGQLPQLKYVVGSNYCDIGIQIDERRNRVIIVSAIDNLIKGSAGQAIQNLNIMAGWDESLGLEDVGMYL
ncbi:N-acetyl-gamma-glutamyl-phosphate reductase [Halonatronum saccharophilum]|uniref:N-acetyl-gamma-glutamyl-phosphate reductase n=1 Tax=Halonatronum saccharophilum TaxID=150060 RepID=UPI000480B6F0|nr:N-acetyl-gamma-glutamyl-phosphate reductase [Halonatronum saccharophilum]